MQRKHLLSLLKLVVVTGLMYYVFTTIQWRDSYLERGPDGSQVVKEGEIQGPWKGERVRFRPLVDGVLGEEKTLAVDGKRIQIKPGLPTYWRNLHLGWFALGALCYLFSLCFSAVRWWWLMSVNGLPVTPAAALRYTWIGIFFNNFVPGQTGGDLVKAIYVVKRCPGGRIPALISVIVDRIMGLGSLTLLAAIAVIFYFDQAEFRPLGWAIWGLLLLVGLMGVVAFSRRIRKVVRLKALLEKLPGRFSLLLQRVDQAVYFYRAHKKGMLMWLLGGMGNHVVSVLSWYLVGRALGVGMPIFDYFVLIPAIIIVSAIPIAPNGWGVGEAMFRYLFAKYGAIQLASLPTLEAQRIMGTRGVALSVLYRIHLTLWSLVGGVIFFLGRDKVTRAELEQEVALEEQEGEAAAQPPQNVGDSAESMG